MENENRALDDICLWHTAHKLISHFVRRIFSVRRLILGDFMIFQVNWTFRECRCVSQCVCCVLQPTRISPGPASGRIPSSDTTNSTVDFSFLLFLKRIVFFQERPDSCRMRTTTWRTRRRRLSSGGKISGLDRWNYSTRKVCAEYSKEITFSLLLNSERNGECYFADIEWRRS